MKTLILHGKYNTNQRLNQSVFSHVKIFDYENLIIKKP